MPTRPRSGRAGARRPLRAQRRAGDQRARGSIRTAGGFSAACARRNYAKLPAGSAPLAAAEAFTFDVDAILNPDPADRRGAGQDAAVPEGAGRSRRCRRWPTSASSTIASPLMGEVLNLLTRRNLLYTVVPAPDRALDLTVQLGTPDFPMEAAANPSEFAARVRAKLGDDKRLVRLYGTSTVIARLTGDANARAAVSAVLRRQPAPAERRRAGASASACSAATSRRRFAALRRRAATRRSSDVAPPGRRDRVLGPGLQHVSRSSIWKRVK